MRTSFQSHRPTRPLPAPKKRPMAKGEIWFVDASKGDDGGAGDKKAPWRSIGKALENVQPGGTVCLRGGVYYERVTCKARGTPGKPVIVRSFPGELAIIDGGYREFVEEPSNAWQEVAGGVAGEFQSVNVYPELAAVPGEKHYVFAGGVFAKEVRVLGNFADSMVPLHGYALRSDLQAQSGYWLVKNKVSKEEGVYCGPGVWFNLETKRVHIRLAHTKLPAMGEHNYVGVTDPRKVPLVIGGADVPLFLDGARHVRIQDLAVRGTRSHTVSLSGCEDIEFDNVEMYGGCPAMYVRTTSGLRMTNCALRGVSAPWSSRSTIKYRGNASYLFVATGETPQNQNFEIAYSEFTDCHDGAAIGSVKGLRFHHNLVDNFNDDGLYLTLWRDRPGEDIHIYQNRISRCLSSLAFAQFGKGIKNEIGPPIYIYRNIFDLREPVHYGHPRDEKFRYTHPGRVGADHGGPIWDPLYFYHNTIIAQQARALSGLNDHTSGSSRRVFNNIIVQLEGLPPLRFPRSDQDFQSDGNLYWSTSDGPGFTGDFFARYRASKPFVQSKERYPPGFTANDKFGDPLFLSFEGDWRKPHDTRLKKGSPAIDAGVELSEDWPDSVRSEDRGKPDIGAFPSKAQPLGIGVNGRIRV
ncbi:MAG: right-handed parallel beta-helix repeat-containing protein, partial [Planctomycetota bacterium]|nr:right-handed parallel beta-helix repeat-containing protein [Planctomycetota bacterium]